MTYGRMFQKMIGKKSMMIMLSGVITLIILSVVMGLKLILKQHDNMVMETSPYNMILKERFICVENANFNGEFEKEESNRASFDLEQKNYFTLEYAIRNDKIYGQNVWEAEEFYNGQLQGFLTSALFNLKISKEDIKRNNFVVECEIYPLLNQKSLRERFPPELENDYKLHGLKKIRLSYSKSFLPIKLEGYFDTGKENRWKDIRRFTYPYKSEKAFNKALDDAIDWIKITEEEEASD